MASYQNDDRVAQVQSEVDAVRGQVGSAIDKAIDRGERLEDIEAKADNLESQASRFHKSARDLKWSMCCKNATHTAILVTIVVIIFLLVLWAAGAFDSSSSSSSSGNGDGNGDGGDGGDGKRLAELASAARTVRSLLTRRV